MPYENWYLWRKPQYTHCLAWHICVCLKIYTDSTKAHNHKYFLIICIIWLSFQVNMLGHLTKYLAMTVFALVAAIEGARLYLGYLCNASCRVGKLCNLNNICSIMGVMYDLRTALVFLAILMSLFLINFIFSSRFRNWLDS